MNRPRWMSFLRPSERSEEDPVLHGWRGVAITLLLIGHMSGKSLLGRLGVEFFFGLSGFLVTGILLREKERYGTVLLSAFYLRRSFRILPAFLAFLATLAVISATDLTSIDVSLAEVASALFFVRNYVSGSFVTDHIWSLAIEEHYYILISTMLLVTPRQRIWQTLVAGITLSWMAAAAYSGLKYLHYLDLDYHGIYWRTETRIHALLLGALGAWIMLHKRFPVLRERTLGIALWTSTAGIAILWIFPVPYLIRHLVGPVLMTAALLCAINTQRHPIRSLLENQLFVQMGIWSYSLYLWQQVFAFGMPVHQRYGVAGALAATLALGLTSFYLLERPLREVGRALARARYPARERTTRVARSGPLPHPGVEPAPGGDGHGARPE